MADAVSELLVTEAAIDKLGSRGITIEESHQLPRNVHVTIRNPPVGATPGERRVLES